MKDGMILHDFFDWRIIKLEGVSLMKKQYMTCKTNATINYASTNLNNRVCTGGWSREAAEVNT